MERQKYILHKSGVALRIPPYLRRELSNGMSQQGQIQVGLMTKSPVIGERGPMDVMPFNVESNLKLRRVAHAMSKDLVDVAKCLNADRYCTVVHGSVARGLVRHSGSDDPSDLDIDLVVDTKIGPELSKVSRTLIYKMQQVYGARVDCYVWMRGEVLRHCAEFGRNYLASCAYPIANEGGLWEEIRNCSLESQRLICLSSSAKKKLQQVLGLDLKNEVDLRQALGDTFGGRQGLEFLQKNNNGRPRNPIEGLAVLRSFLE